MARKKKIQIPKSVTVLGRTWPIFLTEGEATSDDPEFGETDTNAGTITLRWAPHEKFKTPIQSTLLHEVLHAALNVSGNTNLWNEAIEESLVSALEQALFPLIQQGIFTVKKK